MRFMMLLLCHGDKSYDCAAVAAGLFFTRRNRGLTSRGIFFFHDASAFTAHHPLLSSGPAVVTQCLPVIMLWKEKYNASTLV